MATYKYVSSKVSSGKTIRYKITDSDTAYHRSTPDAIVRILEGIRSRRTRVKIHYGDRKTGRSWGDVEVGRIGRSTGRIKIPLVVASARSMGGGALLDHCIVKIEYANFLRTYD